MLLCLRLSICVYLCSRMFPIIEAKLDGLYPERTYAVVIDIVPADQFHWKFTGTEWRIGGPRCEPPMPSRLYVHQESPSSGLHWMQDVINFGKLKITNDKATPGQEVRKKGANNEKPCTLPCVSIIVVKNILIHMESNPGLGLSQISSVHNCKVCTVCPLKGRWAFGYLARLSFCLVVF